MSIKTKGMSIKKPNASGGQHHAAYTYARTLCATGPIASANLIRYAAGTTDPHTTLIKYGLCYYDPTTGQFTQQDTIDTPLDPHNANRYTYAAANPTNYTDPTGANTQQVICTVAAGTSAGLGAVSLYSGVTAAGATGTLLGLPAGTALGIISGATGIAGLSLGVAAWAFC